MTRPRYLQTTVFSRSRSSHPLAPWLGVFLVSAVGCTDGSPRAEPESDSLRLGRIHVVIEPGGIDLDNGSDSASNLLDISARFALVRGLDEDFVRARIGMPLLPHEVLQPSECMPTDQLVTDSSTAPDGTLAPELVLLDAGDLAINIGDATYDVPLALVPDLLPYMSGVEYIRDRETIMLGAEASPTVTVRAGGSQTEELPPLSATGTVPSAPSITVTESDLDEQRRGAMILRWEPSAEELVTLRLLPVSHGEPAGDEVTCVLHDRGMARLDLDRLNVMGIPLDAEGLEVTLSRTHTVGVDTGDSTLAEMVVERRSKALMPLLPR